MASDIGMIGLAVMGQNLALNMENHGWKVSVYNWTPDLTEKFQEGAAKGRNFHISYDLADFVASLSRPRKIMLMIRAGTAVDSVIESLKGLLEAGDVIIDGGNSEYCDTERRYALLHECGIHFVGAGVSGGEEGALKGPAIMPGGDEEARDAVLPILSSISAKADDGRPCCSWMGKGGSGHFVKMVHNGIEYADMQLISEAYFLMKRALSLSNAEMADIFEKWNDGRLSSYLIEITAKILRRKDSMGEGELLDKILDAAGQKGTGKWSVINALEYGVPLHLISTAVFERNLSSLKDLRSAASSLFPLSKNSAFTEGDIDKIRDSLYASKLISYAQGFALLKKASEEHNWKIDLKAVAEIWRGGCIIRSAFLNKIAHAYENLSLKHMLFDGYFRDEILSALPSLRETVSKSALSGTALPAMSSALNYFYALTTECSAANLIQAQRDYFGAHTFERLDRPRGEHFHEDWTDLGGKVSSSVYNA